MIDRNHPAVEALGFEGFDHEGGTLFPIDGAAS